MKSQNENEVYYHSEYVRLLQEVAIIRGETQKLHELINNLVQLISTGKLDVAIENFGLSLRAKNILTLNGVRTVRDLIHGVRTVKDLIQLRFPDLLKMRGMGRKSYEEIRGFLKDEFNFHL